MKNLRFFFTAFVILGANVLLAAPPPPPSGGGATGGPVCWPPPCIPVDNGVIFLIIAGALYGAKKIYDLHKKPQPLS
jgi:hypothetical protein